MTQRELILQALDGEPMQRSAIAEECGIDANCVSAVLSQLKDEGLITRVPDGWTLAAKAPRRRRAVEPDPTAPGALDEHFGSSAADAPPRAKGDGAGPLLLDIPRFVSPTLSAARPKLVFAISESGDLLIDRIDGSGARAVIERDEARRLMQFLARCEALLEVA